MGLTVYVVTYECCGHDDLMQIRSTPEAAQAVIDASDHLQYKHAVVTPVVVDSEEFFAPSEES